VRAQGAFVGEDEIARIMDALKANGEPKFDEEFVARLEKAEEEDDSQDSGGGSSHNADVSKADLESALEVLMSTQRASTSMLQRKLGWGYNRAARVMEELEDRGVVAPGEGARPREILRSTLD
jgi:S-DNA-T family DNA segregation ATPase FtsK/SpoIIIE